MVTADLLGSPQIYLQKPFGHCWSKNCTGWMLFLTHDLLTVSKCWRHDCLMSIDVCTVSILAASLIISNVSPATTADVFIHRHHRCYWSDETPLITVSDHAFLVAGIRLWNSLPHVVTSAPILAVFQNRLKTDLFFRLFSHWLSLSPFQRPFSRWT